MGSSDVSTQKGNSKRLYLIANGWFSRDYFVVRDDETLAHIDFNVVDPDAIVQIDGYKEVLFETNGERTEFLVDGKHVAKSNMRGSKSRHKTHLGGQEITVRPRRLMSRKVTFRNSDGDQIGKTGSIKLFSRSMYLEPPAGLSLLEELYLCALALHSLYVEFVVRRIG